MQDSISLENNVVALKSQKKNVSVKQLCQDEDIAAFYKLIVEKDLRKKAIEALEKRIFNIREN